MRKQHKEDYWNTQTQAENMWLENFRKERHAKQLADLNHWCTKICTTSQSTKNTLKFLHNKNEGWLEKMRLADIKNLREQTDKRLMLDAMQIEQQSQKWPDLLTLDTRINADVIIPQTVLNFHEY